MRLLIKQNIEDILFFDVETAKATNEFSEEHPLYSAWAYDHLRNVEDESELIDLYNSKASLYAEYGRIVTISIGAIRDGKLIVKSFYDEDEKVLLEKFNDSLSKFANNKTYLCGHNILDFDMPFIAKRCVVNGILQHMLFDTAHLKPWETSVFDTAILWKGTGWKKQSLASVMAALSLPSPKDDISGADVSRVFYEGGIDRIVKYCEKDVLGVVRVVQKLRHEDVIEELTSVTEAAEAPVNLLEFIRNGGELTEEVMTKLKGLVNDLSDHERKIAIDILNTIPSRAKGKANNLTKKMIKEL